MSFHHLLCNSQFWMRYSSLAGDQQGLLLNHRSNLGGRVLVAFVVSNWNALLLEECWVGFCYARVLSSPLNQSQSEDKSKLILVLVHSNLITIWWKMKVTPPMIISQLIFNLYTFALCHSLDQWKILLDWSL